MQNDPKNTPVPGFKRNHDSSMGGSYVCAARVARLATLCLHLHDPPPTGAEVIYLEKAFYRLVLVLVLPAQPTNTAKISGRPMVPPPKSGGDCSDCKRVTMRMRR